MKIATIVFKNYRGFEDIEIHFAPRLTLILAMNGVGKTSIIEGIATSLNGLIGVAQGGPSKKIPNLLPESDHRRVWPHDAQLPTSTVPNIVIDATASWNKTDVTWQVHSTRSAKTPIQTEGRIDWSAGKTAFIETLNAATMVTNPPLPLLAGLRAQRSFRGDKTPLPNLTAKSSVTSERLVRWGAGIFVDTRWYPLRDRWYELEIAQSQQGKRGENACKTIRCAVQRALFNDDAENFHAVFNPDEQDFIVSLPGERFRAVGLMSDGWRSYVSTIVALAIRCAEINPASEDAAAITPGILLIDEIEQHLHPALQLKIVNGLQNAFPKLQIIATTHSPLVLTDMPADDSSHIIRLDRDDGVNEIRVEELPAPIGRDAVQVLTGVWFGLASTLDDGTLDLLAKHRKLLREGPTAKEERLRVEAELRTRLKRYADTSVEEFVLSVVAELEAEPRFDKLSHSDMKALREKVVAKIKDGLE